MNRLLIAIVVLFPSLSAAQTTVDIVGVRDNFIAAGIAAQKCNVSDRSRQEVHDRNFTIVSKRAMELIMSRGPDLDQEELRRKDLQHIEQLQDATFNLLRAEGCKSEKVRALLRMHKLHETIRF